MAAGIYLCKDRETNVKYLADITADRNGIIVYREVDDKRDVVIGSVIDCGTYVSTAVRTGVKAINLFCKIPVQPYETQLVGVLSEFDKERYKIRTKTSYGNVLSVHLASFKKKERVFRQFIITINDGNEEKIVDRFKVADDGEMDIITSGTPTGAELNHF